MMDTSPIWTLNARDNVILDVLNSHLALTDSQTRSIITGSRDELLQILTRKGIDYGTLRAGLVPQRDREEYVFLFEVQELDAREGETETIRETITQSSLWITDECDMDHIV